MFDGKSWTVTGLYLIPVKVGIGKFQPYGRFTNGYYSKRALLAELTLRVRSGD